MESEDALIVEVFRKAGAVFHVKTTDPQSLLVGAFMILSEHPFAFAYFN